MYSPCIPSDVLLRASTTSNFFKDGTLDLPTSPNPCPPPPSPVHQSHVASLAHGDPEISIAPQSPMHGVLHPTTLPSPSPNPHHYPRPFHAFPQEPLPHNTSDDIIIDLSGPSPSAAKASPMEILTSPGLPIQVPTKVLPTLPRDVAPLATQVLPMFPPDVAASGAPNEESTEGAKLYAKRILDEVENIVIDRASNKRRRDGGTTSVVRGVAELLAAKITNLQFKRTRTSKRKQSIISFMRPVKTKAERTKFLELYPKHTKGNTTSWQNMACEWNMDMLMMLLDTNNGDEVPAITLKSPSHLQGFGDTIVEKLHHNFSRGSTQVQKKLAQASIRSFAGPQREEPTLADRRSGEGSSATTHGVHTHSLGNTQSHAPPRFDPLPTALPKSTRSMHVKGKGKGGGGRPKSCQLCKCIDGIVVHIPDAHRKECPYQQLLARASVEVPQGILTARIELESRMRDQKGYGGKKNILSKMYPKLYPGAEDGNENEGQ
jgi:hypothetical protein